MKRSQIKVDPEKVKAWQERSRQTPRGQRRTRDQQRARDSLPGRSQWKKRVFELYGPFCLVLPGERAVQAHHIVPKRVILAAPQMSKDEREALAYDPVNGLPISLRAHERHENATARVPRAALPETAIAWAYEHGFGWFIDDERVYP